ncbi:relaxase/mobilization nuclease domain-containing protein [Spirillospora sp. NPDC048823]|uniref:relaxase/mobilization nuclease domain-containing protein n=1 Tax=unclassified Spirillospora TaxID=2642701 RepID=UPI0037213FF1
MTSLTNYASAFPDAGEGRSLIGKVLRGKRVQGLIRYLYGPGRHGEHRDPHIVAGFRSPGELEPGLHPDGTRDFRHLDGLLTQPLALLGERNYRKPVWHLSVRAAPEDPSLSDQQWAEVANEIMARTGLAPDGDEDAVRWIAVRHADDHVHIVATLARADGVRPDVWNDGYRIRDGCRAMEERFGLRSTAPADRTAARRPKRAETEKALRVGRGEPARNVLRRHVAAAAAGARTEAEFFAALGAEGVLVRKRESTRVAGQITGYAVALSDDLGSSGRPVWFGGGKLASDLTLPQLRRRWTPEGAGGPPPRPLSGRHLSARTIRAIVRTTVRRAADEAWTTGEFLDLLQQRGLLVRCRYSQSDPDQVTGYAVALPDGEPVWHTGGRLGDDLTLPRIQQRWKTSAGGAQGRSADLEDDLTLEERQALYDDAAHAAAHATSQLRRHLAINPYAAQDACWAASDALQAAAKATGNLHLRRAADTYDRAARAPYGRIPRPSPAGNALRTAARLLTLAGDQHRTTVSILMLVSRLITLVDTIAQLRRLQQRQAQADAARTAYRHLSRAKAAAGHHLAPQPEEPILPSPVRQAMAAFPDPWAPVPSTPVTQRPAVPVPPTRREQRAR